MDWNVVDIIYRVNLCLHKCGGRFFNFSDAPPEIFFILFLAVNVNPSPLDSVIGVDFVKNIFLLIGQGSQPLLPIAWNKLHILAQHFDH
jgi:hypothetical protein